MSEGCGFYGDALVDLERGRLGGERARRVERHAAGCAECRDALEVIRVVRRRPAPVPAGLEGRIRAAVRRATREPEEAVPTGSPSAGSKSAWRVGRRVWALPLAVAAALAIWLGGGLTGTDTDAGDASADVVTEYDPYGSWPATDGVVAGDVVLSELSVEELEALLEEMES